MRAAWSADLSKIGEAVIILKSIRKNLDGLNICLCPHRKINDPWIVETLHRITHPEDVTEDPVKEWLIKEGARRRSEQYKKKCKHCGAEFKIEESTNPARYPVVHVTRFSGKGQSADDPIWLAQCNVQA